MVTKDRGSVYFDKRKSRWIGIVDVGTTVDGKRKRQRVYGATRTEATRKLATLLYDIQVGRPTPDGSMRFDAFFSRWLAQTIEPNASSINTSDHYRLIVDKHLIPAFGKKRLRDLTVDDVELFINSKYDAGYAPSTVRRMRMTLVKGLRDAERKDLVVRNVASLTDLRRSRPAHGRSLSEAEANELLQAAKGSRLELAINIGLQMGLRPGETLGLSWNNVDLERRILVVDQSLKRERNQLRIGGVKTPTSRRSISIPDPLIKLFIEQSHRQKLDQWVSRELWCDTGLVMTTNIGTAVDPSNLRRELRRISSRAGLGNWSPNALRHSFASILSARGVALESIADAMGHIDTRMTSLVYRHQLVEVADAPTVIDGIFQ